MAEGEFASVWPRVDNIEQYNTPEKIKELCMQCINYAIASHTSSTRKSRLATMNNNYNFYNGVVNTKSVQFLNKTYGKQNITKYIDYRWGRTKLGMLNGEFLRQPLKASVYTVNPEAKSSLLDQFNIAVAMKHAAPEINKLRTVAGANVLGGMPIPGEDDDALWEKLNAKQKNQMIMQILLNRQLQSEDCKTKFSSNLTDAHITSECYGKVYIDAAGYVRYREIDPRDALFEELDRDPYILKSPYMGERRWMFASDVVSEWPDLDELEKKRLYDFASSGDLTSLSDGNRNYYKRMGGKLYILTHTIEFYTFQSNHYLSTKSGETVEIGAEEAASPRLKTRINRGDVRYTQKYKKTIWQSTKIGPDMYTQTGPKPNIIGSISNPNETLYSYVGLLLNTKDGIRVSLQEVLNDIGEVLNVSMFQLRRELAKAKGKVLPYDKAGLPKNMTMKEVIHQAINDGFIAFSSAAEGIAANISGERLNNIAGFLKEIDLGISSTVPVLINIMNQMLSMLDNLTGVNENRQGDIAASSTATNANNSIQASRTITLPIYYFFSRFLENIMLRMVEYSKLAYGILNPQLGESLLGTAGVQFLKITRDLSYDDFAAFIADGRREQEIRDLLRQWMPLSINAGELRVQDAIRVELSEILPEALEKLDEAWKMVKDVAAQEQQANTQAQQQNTQAIIQSKAQSEDKKYDHEKLIKILDYLLKAGLITQEAKNEYLHEASLMQQQGAMEAAGAQGQPQPQMV